MWIWPLGMGKILQEPIRRRRLKELSGGLCRVGNRFLDCVTPPPPSSNPIKDYRTINVLFITG